MSDNLKEAVAEAIRNGERDCGLNSHAGYIGVAHYALAAIMENYVILPKEVHHGEFHNALPLNHIYYGPIMYAWQEEAYCLATERES